MLPRFTNQLIKSASSVGVKEPILLTQEFNLTALTATKTRCAAACVLSIHILRYTHRGDIKVEPTLVQRLQSESTKRTGPAPTTVEKHQVAEIALRFSARPHLCPPALVTINAAGDAENRRAF